MPASNATVKTPAKKAPVRRKRAAATKSRKAAATPQPIVVDLPKANTTPLKKRPMQVEAVELKSLKDYPRDGLALILLPVLYLEALVKAILPVIGRVKVNF